MPEAVAEPAGEGSGDESSHDDDAEREQGEELGTAETDRGKDTGYLPLRMRGEMQSYQALEAA